MQIVLDSERENGWHREWMQRTSNAYEWWYADIISDDRRWSLVAIYLLGNPFSAYYRSCKQGKNDHPFVYNAVFFALHKYGHLHHYLFAKYPQDRVVLAPSSALDGKFGPNSISFHPGEEGLNISLSERNGNNRFVDARITIRSDVQSKSDISSLKQGGLHWWLPSIAAGRAQVDLRICSQGVSNERERIRFDGSGYHDHNWGTLPFDSTVSHWTWARADFGNGTAAIIYWLTDTLGQSSVSLLYYERNVLKVFNRHASVDTVQPSFSKFGSRFPGRYTISSGLVAVTFIADQRLEDVPFYIRYRHTAVLIDAGTRAEGVGHGEYFRPGVMGTGAVAWGMERRIFEPSNGR